MHSRASKIIILGSCRLRARFGRQFVLVVVTPEAKQQVLYSAFIQTALGDAARKALEMHPQGEKFLSDSQRHSFEKGRAEGRAAEKAADVLAVLEARGLAVTDAQRQRIIDCSELDTLNSWLRRAVTVTSADNLFE